MIVSAPKFSVLVRQLKFAATVEIFYILQNKKRIVFTKTILEIEVLYSRVLVFPSVLFSFVLVFCKESYLHCVFLGDSHSRSTIVHIVKPQICPWSILYYGQLLLDGQRLFIQPNVLADHIFYMIPRL